MCEISTHLVFIFRFDYTGCGGSEGSIKECTIGKWKKDVLSILDDVAEGPQILVGSSMGGWLMLLAALARPEKIAALVGVAPAADHFVTAFNQLPSEEHLPDLQSAFAADVSGCMQGEYLLNSTGLVDIHFTYREPAMSAAEADPSFGFWLLPPPSSVMASLPGSLLRMRESRCASSQVPAVFCVSQNTAGEDGEKKVIEETGEWKLPSKYCESGFYSIPYSFVKEAENHCILNGPIPLTSPVRLIHGMKDEDVPWHVSLQIADRVISTDVDVILRKHGQHRMSEKDDIKLLVYTIDDLIDKLITLG
ncbi:hypothetical protein AB205_0197710 [Aquarana catesbeiana]|uniref:Palmitoyl-protein thioesterase ABHD10, mitochondrial n=1 Tax=Aquarana catesbeiana TaxID=8400 RepID=A0A2G9S2V1_AQUCT|nr:hypothetical protein AB205_0197710 [Aquarana catesbeiana]